MMNTLSRTTLLVVLALQAPAQDGAGPAPGDWPQWRGPQRDGISREVDWKAEGRTLWEVEVGQGYSTVSVSDGRLYTVGYDEQAGLDVIWCLDAETGEERWVHTYPAKKWAQAHQGGTLSTPSVDGDRVYVLNREGRFSCLDAKTGVARFALNVEERFGLKPPTWGFSASPLVLDDMVVLNVGKVLAYEKGEPELLWSSKRSYGHAYSTPTDCTLRGKPCLAVLGSDGLAVLDRATGEELGLQPWKTKYDVNAASPVFVGDDRILISSGANHGAAVVELGADGLQVVWESKVVRNHLSTSVLVGGHLYGLDESILKCMDVDGNELWRQRGLGKGALSAAGDRLIVVSSRGELIVAEASPKGYKELSREKVLDGGVCWTMPVLAHGRIYVKNRDGQLVCRDHRETTE